MICPVCSAGKSTFVTRAIRNGFEIEYVRCSECRTVFAPEVLSWEPGDFKRKIYNTDYAKFDPDFVEKRPRIYADSLYKKRFVSFSGRHLDYGGGNGKLSQILRNEAGWDSQTFDRYYGDAKLPEGKFDLVTAIEVFEHAVNVHELWSDLSKLVAPGGILFVSTWTAPDNLESMEHWWYMLPRNGHFIFYSTEAFDLLEKQYGFERYSSVDAIHCFQKVTRS